MATDVGLQRYSRNNDEDSSLLALGAALPADIRRGLLELDWYRSETEKERDRHAKWDNLPLSSLPITGLNFLEHERMMESGKSPSTASNAVSASLLTRKTSSAAGGVRRRPVFVPLLASIVASLAQSGNDLRGLSPVISRDVLFMVARDDPALVLRPIFEGLEDSKISPSTISLQLTGILRLHSSIPPALSHYMFNHVAGYIKLISKDGGRDIESLRSYASMMFVAAELAGHVSDLAIRDIRRNKLDPLLLPTFELWFPASSTITHPTRGAMRDVEDYRNQSLSTVISIRTAQNLFLLRLLRRAPKEAPSIRKSLLSFQLPEALSLSRPLDASHFVSSTIKLADETASLHSLNLAKSYLLLVQQLFRTYSPTTSDMTEIATLIDGINVALLIHGEDLAVLSQALSAYLTACTRFRRLFVSNDGYRIILPPLLRIYASSYESEDVRAAIEYAVHRFYALHEKAFVFQGLDVLSQMMAQPAALGLAAKDRFAESSFSLFASLDIQSRYSERDGAGLQAAAKYLEKEALLSLLSDPADLLAASGLSNLTPVEAEFTVPALAGSLEKWHTQRFPLDDLIRLFLTIIAHSPGEKRAENFLKLMRMWVKHFYDAPQSRTVLQAGIEALGNVVFRGSKIARTGVDGTPSISNPESLAEAGLVDEPIAQVSTSDPLVMRQEYVRLIVEFNKCGGQLAFTPLQRTFEVIKMMVKDYGIRFSDVASSFVQESLRRFLKKDERPHVKHLVLFLGEVGQLFRVHGDLINLAEGVDIVRKLLDDAVLSRDRTFVGSAIEEFCKPAIEACSAAAASQTLAHWPAKDALPLLFSVASSIPGTFAIDLVVAQPPSAAYLSGFILPLCRILPTTEEMEDKDPSTRHSDHGSIWRRLLAYVMQACRTASAPDKPGAERKEEESAISSIRERISVLALGVQVVKLLVVRGERDLERSVPGIWSRLAHFFRELLADGDLSFAVRGDSQSPSATPSQSRSASPNPYRSSVSSDPREGSSFHQGLRRRVRAMDYILASLFHFMVIYRSPLIIQCRLWIQEHVVRLSNISNTTRNSALSPLPSPALTPMPSPMRGLSPGEPPRPHRISSMYSKLRPRHSALIPDPSSPSGNQLSFGSSSSVDPFEGERLPGFQRSRPSSLDFGNKPIVHLGPVVIHEPMSSPISDDGRESMRSNTRSIFVSTPEVVRLSMQNVQDVQTWFGYLERNVRAWSKLDALRALNHECQVLDVEFSESFYGSLGQPFVEIPFSETRSAGS